MHMHVFFSCWVVLHPKQQLHMKVLVEVPTKMDKFRVLTIDWEGGQPNTCKYNYINIL